VSPPRLAATRQPILEEIVRHAMRRGSAIRREAALYVEERREYEIAVLPVRDSPDVGDWLLTIRDLKPERTMAILRREFVANVSHELKTPLTSIRGYAETLLQGGMDDEENRARFVETIHAQAVRLEALVEDLLELADLERPDAALDLKDWDLSSLLRDMASGFEELAARRGIRLDLEAPPELHARLDRDRIEVALRNLLDNAIKYTETGTVRITAERAGGVVLVAIADTGRGIEPEHRARIFERFYRVDHGRSRASGGTGLGLSIVKHAIELHGGRVGVESSPGSGSRFWFEIPADGPGRAS
jgi:two-component system phosphate regulon sensor histidine kinase PhoR